MENPQKQPIDYYNAKQSPPPSSSPAKNFGFGVLIVIAATIAVFAGAAVAQNGGVFLVLAAGAILAVIITAIVSAGSGKRPGFAAGLLVTTGVVLLVFGGLCFYVIAHI